MAANCPHSSEPNNILVLFSKDLENFSGEDSRNDDGSRGDLSTASDDVNTNNATVSTTAGFSLYPGHAFSLSLSQEVLFPWITLGYCNCLLFLVACSSIILSSRVPFPQGFSLSHLLLGCLWFMVKISSVMLSLFTNELVSYLMVICIF